MRISKPSDQGENIEGLKRMREQLLSLKVDPNSSNMRDCIRRLDKVQDATQKQKSKKKSKRQQGTR